MEDFARFSAWIIGGVSLFIGVVGMAFGNKIVESLIVFLLGLVLICLEIAVCRILDAIAAKPTP